MDSIQNTACTFTTPHSYIQQKNCVYLKVICCFLSFNKQQDEYIQYVFLKPDGKALPILMVSQTPLGEQMKSISLHFTLGSN